jgi:hypothetical protein
LVSGPVQAQWEPPKNYRTSPLYENLPLLTPHVFGEMQEKSSLFFTYSGGPGCSASNAFAADFFPHRERHFPEVPVFIIDDVSEVGLRTQLKSVVPLVPLVLVFRGTKLIDGQVGVGGRQSGGRFDALLQRIGLPAHGGSSSAKDVHVFWRKDWRGKKVLRSGLREIIQTLAEVDAQGADFTGVTVGPTIITHSDFLNAKIQNGIFKNVLWVNTRCPDGSNSDEHGYTCVGF